MSLKEFITNVDSLTHEECYNEIINMIGEDKLVRLIPFTEDAVAEALSSGDEHLNTLPLRKWDSMYEQVRAVGREYVVSYAKKMQVRVVYEMSLAESVCILKQTARKRYYNKNN